MSEYRLYYLQEVNYVHVRYLIPHLLVAKVSSALHPHLLAWLYRLLEPNPLLWCISFLKCRLGSDTGES